MLAVPGDYAAHVHTFRLLQGGLRPGGVVLDQQMAATLQAQARRHDQAAAAPERPAAVPYTVTGVGLITAPDQVFQPLNPLLGPAPAQPPQNAAIMLTGTFARTLAPQLPTIATGASGASAQPGAQTGTQWQVQAQLDRGPLAAGSPSTALKRATQTVNRIQSDAAGPGPVRRQPLRLAQHRGRRCALRRDPLPAARGAGCPDRPRRRLPRRPRDERERPPRPGAAARSGRPAAGSPHARRSRERADRAGRRDRSARRSGSPRSSSWSAAAPSSPSGAGRPPLLAAVGLAIAGSAAARLASTREVLATEVSEGRRATRARSAPAWRRYYLDFLCARAQRADLLAHDPDRLLRGAQPGLEPDPVAVGLHVLRPGAALDRGDAAAGQAARPLHERPRSPRGAPAGQPRLAGRLEPRAPGGRRSTGGWS